MWKAEKQSNFLYAKTDEQISSQSREISSMVYDKKERYTLITRLKTAAR
jgi:hypothetical protein